MAGTDGGAEQQHDAGDVARDEHAGEHQEDLHRRATGHHAQVQRRDGGDDLERHGSRHGTGQRRLPPDAAPRAEPVETRADDGGRERRGDGHDELDAEAVQAEPRAQPGDLGGSQDHEHDRHHDRGREAEVAELADERAEALALEQPRHHALDDAHRSGTGPDHARDRREQQPSGVAVRAQDQLDQLVAHVGGQDPRGPLGQLLRLGVVAQRDRRQRGHAERQRDQADREEPRERGDVVAHAVAPVELDGRSGQTPRRGGDAMHEDDCRADRRRRTSPGSDDVRDARG
jgi:hypothetical protein